MPRNWPTAIDLLGVPPRSSVVCSAWHYFYTRTLRWQIRTTGGAPRPSPLPPCHVPHPLTTSSSNHHTLQARNAANNPTTTRGDGADAAGHAAAGGGCLGPYSRSSDGSSSWSVDPPHAMVGHSGPVPCVRERCVWWIGRCGRSVGRWMDGMDESGMGGRLPPLPRPPSISPSHSHRTHTRKALLSLEAGLATNDTAAFSTVLEASFASGRVIEVRGWMACSPTTKLPGTFGIRIHKQQASGRHHNPVP